MNRFAREWWRPARLTFVGKEGRILASSITGPLAELIAHTCELPAELRGSARIDIEDQSGLEALTWPDISELYRRDDFPVII